MKVLFIQRRANQAGAQVCLAKTVQSLQGLKVPVKVLTGESGWLTDRLQEMGALAGMASFPALRSPISRWLKSGLFSIQVNNIRRRQGPFDLVHANDTWEALLAQRLSQKWNIPWLVHLRITSLDEAHYRKYHCHRADGLIAVSPAVYDLVKDWPHQLLEYIPEGLGEEDFLPLSDRAPRFPREIGVIGHGGEIKGWDDLGPALRTVKERGGILPAKMVFLGTADAQCRTRLRQNLPPEVELVFTGHVPDLPEQLRRLDLILTPARQESFGMAMVETIAAGVPLLASRTGIAPYLMGEGSPWSFAPGDPDDLAAAWLRLPAVWPGRKDALAAWRQKLQHEFLMDNTTKKLIITYQRLLNKR